jgi:hypothetical protein
MLDYKNAAQALQELQKQGLVWLLLLDVVPEKSGKDVAIWECTTELNINEKGIIWKEAILLNSPNGIAVLENALSNCSTTQIYFNNQLIQAS